MHTYIRILVSKFSENILVYKKHEKISKYNEEEGRCSSGVSATVSNSSSIPRYNLLEHKSIFNTDISLVNNINYKRKQRNGSVNKLTEAVTNLSCENGSKFVGEGKNRKAGKPDDSDI